MESSLVLPSRFAKPLKATASRVNPFLQGALYVFAFALPFETLNPWGVAETFSLARIAGLLLAVFACTQPQLWVLRPPPAAAWFGLYLIIYLISGVVAAPEHLDITYVTVFTLLQNVIAFWICANLMKDDRVAVRALTIFAAGAFVTSLLALSGVKATELQTFDPRVSFSRKDPNNYAFVLAMGILVLTGVLFIRSSASTVGKYVRWLAFAPMVLQLVRTGSRGGALCLLAGVVVLLVRSDRLQGRLKGAVVLAVMLLFGTWAVVSDESMSDRWQGTLEQGEIAGRSEIMENAFQMFLEAPLTGWGATRHLYVLADRCGTLASDIRDTHSDLLWAMASTGLLGTVPVLIGVGLCCRSAWRARNGSHGWLPLALVAAVLAMSMTVTVHNRKETWLAFAYATAAGSGAALGYGRPRRPWGPSPREREQGPRNGAP